MADDDFDLGDDDLDLGDGGDDFAGELDDMMGDDELGDEVGSDDSDSELDSFFEDLSSIEEMDTGEPAPAAPAPAAPAAAAEAPPKAAEAPAKKEKAAGGSSKKKLFIIIGAVVVLLSALAGGAYWYFMSEPAVDEVKIPVETLPTPKNTIVVEPIAPPKITQPAKPVYVPPPEPVTPEKYFIQVAKCSFDKCREDYLQMIREEGEPAYQKSSGDQYDFIELISRQVYHEREAREIVEKINANNSQAGNASVVSLPNGYRVTMGTFMALERAKGVKFHVERLFPNKLLTLNMEHVRKSYDTIKIYAGPYDSREEMKRVLENLRKKRVFRGAFPVRMKG